MRPIDRMRKAFGRSSLKCGGCRHFVPRPGGLAFMVNAGKCRAYGVGAGVDTDWSSKWEGCGMNGTVLTAGFVPLGSRERPAGACGAKGKCTGQLSMEEATEIKTAREMIRRAREAESHGY